MAENYVKSDKGVKVVMGGNGEPFVDVIFKGIPLKLWNEWTAECDNKYNDIRWLKLWSDHLVSAGRVNDRDEIIREVMEHINFETERAQETQSSEDEIAVLSGRA